jgi:hypothetical protein
MSDTSENNAAKAIVANVVRRLIRYQADEYEAAREILDICSLSEQARKIVREEPVVVAALYAIAYNQNDKPRDHHGRPIGVKFVFNKVLQMKPNPYREQTAMLLRELVTDFLREMGDHFPIRSVLVELYKSVRTKAVEEDGQSEQLAA